MGELVKRLRESGSRSEIEIHEDREEAADRIEELEAKLAKAVAEITYLRDKAKVNGFGSDYIICHNCVDTYHSSESTLAELKGTKQ